MKAKEVMAILGITRQTLYNYKKKGLVKIDSTVNGQYQYNEESVYALVSKKPRVNVAYCRVSTNNQKTSLETQEEKIKSFCLNSGAQLNSSYKEVSSGMTLERKALSNLLLRIFNYEVDTVYVTNRDRLTRLSFPVLKEIFNRFGTKIIAISDVEETPTEEKEILSDIIALIHSFSMKMYSKRRKNKLELIEKDLELEKTAKD